MENERYLIKKIIEKITKICVLPAFLMLGLTFIMGFYYNRNVYYKLNDITIELGDKLPEDVLHYVNLLTDSSNLAIESTIPLDEDGRTTIIGKYNYYLAYNDSNYKYSALTYDKATVTVIDTVNPEITIKDNVKIAYNSKFDVNKVAQCFDLSGCKMYIEEDIDTTKSGEYEVTIVATDGANNVSYAKNKIKVLAKPKPVVYSNYNYVGGLETINNLNNSKNASLSEEEKASLRLQVVEFAKRFIGNPYVYGGTSLTNGTDCSGFTMSVYANFGYSLPRVAMSQGYVGKAVSASELMPGDLVVYYYSNGGGHAGIYAGGGMMVHAGTAQTGIVLAPMFPGYRVYRRVIY